LEVDARDQSAADDRTGSGRVRRPSELEHVEQPAEEEWTRHLRILPEGSESLQLAGCRVAMPPPPPMPFWLAVQTGAHLEVKSLLDAGEAVDQLGGPYGSTALGWAAIAGDLPLARLLLAHGATPNVKARKGSTPMHMATWNGDHDELVDLLLEAGGDTTVTNAAGHTPLAQARDLDQIELKALATTRYAMDAWRAQWGKTAPGRAKVIARLQAVQDAATAADSKVARHDVTEGDGAKLESEDAVAEATADAAGSAT